jgi:hypothetical protein
MKASILALLAASVSVFGGSIALTGSSSTVAFTPGSPNTLTFGGGEIDGVFTAVIPITWSISGGTFDYNNSTPASITSGNPVSFSLTADSGADFLTGVVTLASLANGPSDSAAITGSLTVSTVGFGASVPDEELKALLVADAGGPITAGESFGLTISVTGCTSDGPAVCIVPFRGSNWKRRRRGADLRGA